MVIKILMCLYFFWEWRSTPTCRHMLFEDDDQHPYVFICLLKMMITPLCFSSVFWGWWSPLMLLYAFDDADHKHYLFICLLRNIMIYICIWRWWWSSPLSVWYSFWRWSSKSIFNMLLEDDVNNPYTFTWRFPHISIHVLLGKIAFSEFSGEFHERSFFNKKLKALIDCLKKGAFGEFVRKNENPYFQ